MAKGRALTIGLNSVDPRHYGGWSGELNACEADAQDMAEIAKSKKFSVKTLLTKAATRVKLMADISRAARALKPGDIFMLSYSGHGGQVPDINNDEPDAQDETWCLYDGELVDDEIYAHLGKFAQGVRILVFSDSCHSGTVVKLAYYQGTTAARGSGLSAQQVRYRFMPPDVALRTYRDNKNFYDKILRDKKIKDSIEAVKASVLLISGCQDNQLSADGDFNGLFTSQLLRVWKNGAFRGDYRRFHKEILRLMPPDQTPNYFRAGTIDKKFEAQTPFTI
ncbi:MAG: peptidase C14 [Deltaproteobacteria bacterium RBG_13_52_11]|nr:MAG: peptidase C14 [Deltaproteobacteria bacterium RBG_13_52_11]